MYQKLLLKRHFRREAAHWCQDKTDSAMTAKNVRPVQQMWFSELAVPREISKGTFEG